MYPPSSWILLLGSKLASAGHGRSTEVMPDAAHSLAGSFREAVLPEVLHSPLPSGPFLSPAALGKSFLFLSSVPCSFSFLSLSPTFFLQRSSGGHTLPCS